MHTTCENCGATVPVSTGAALRHVTRDASGEYLIVQSDGSGDVLVHRCPMAADRAAS